MNLSSASEIAHQECGWSPVMYYVYGDFAMFGMYNVFKRHQWLQLRATLPAPLYPWIVPFINSSFHISQVWTGSRHVIPRDSDTLLLLHVMFGMSILNIGNTLNCSAAGAIRGSKLYRLQVGAGISAVLTGEASS